MTAMPYVGCEGISWKKISTSGVTFSFAPYSTTPHVQILNTCRILVHPWVAQYMLNGVLHNPGTYTKGHSICVWYVCTLDNGHISECYTGTILSLLIECPSIYYHNQISDISKTLCINVLIPIYKNCKWVAWVTKQSFTQHYTHFYWCLWISKSSEAQMPLYSLYNIKLNYTDNPETYYQQRTEITNSKRWQFWLKLFSRHCLVVHSDDWKAKSSS